MHEGQDFLALLGGVADLANLEEARSLLAVVRGRPRCPLGAVVFSLLCKPVITGVGFLVNVVRTTFGTRSATVA